MLTIYRASAGAGKTHRLTGEYLLLLFSRSGAYRRILAVTFTNKATDEMKGRIVEELFHLVIGQQSDYVPLLVSFYHLTEEEVRREARKILIAILHDYSAFNISTIDRFFQQTMRAFTREIGLQGGYGIEMDQERVLIEAVDRLLSELDQPENKKLLGWLLRFAEVKVEDGGEWNLRRDITALGREVFKESYKVFSEEVACDINNKQALEIYKDTLYGIIRTVEKEIREIGKNGLAIMERYGLTPADFKGGKTSQMFCFSRWAAGEIKVPSMTFCKFADNLEACLTQKMDAEQKAIIGTAFENGLNEYIKKAIARFEQMTDYNTAREIIRYYYTLGILTDISREIAAYREEKNVMLIADTTELLNRVIAGSNAPFIYEKTGTQIDHFMIDEFQDTSGMQWENFRPLIEESLAHNCQNLVVGDVKQSIYRFRNSDWKLLDEQVARDFPAEEIREETLKENWRSCRHIVEFNNALFTVAPYLLQAAYNDDLSKSSLDADAQTVFSTRIMAAYKRSYQRVPKPFQEKDGHVRVEFVTGAEESDWKEAALKCLPSVLQQLQTNGYALKDIAILVRSNNEGAQVANYLLQYKEEHPNDGFYYDLISDEALYVNSSAAVRFLIAILYHLKSPDNPTWTQMLLFSYRILTTDWQRSDFTSEEKAEMNRLSTLPLYEMVEGLYRLFDSYIHEKEQVFVLAFLDLVAEYVQKENADLGRFLSWWEDFGIRKTIDSPDGQNAIRILTVHKSKGLGFRAVILPFTDWEIDHKPMKPVVLWCHPEKPPFNQLHLVPVRYGSSLGATIFARDYFQERLHAYIDNLNTLYVAFTRSKEELIIFSPRPKKVKDDGSVEKISSISDLLWSSLQQSIPDTPEGEPLVSLASSFDWGNNLFEIGDWWKPKQKAVDTLIREFPLGKLQSVSSGNRLHLRLRGQNYFFDDTQRKQGSLMHEILSIVRVPADISQAVHWYQEQGVISREEETRLIQQLQTCLQQPEVQRWYSGQAQILNEVDILFGRGETKRPDRIMIFTDEVVILDYKFGEKISRSHQTQMRNYIRLIRQMGYKNVSAYLWYVTLSRIEAVKA